MQHQPFSTSICNECVLNINNFYAFKKKVLDAQDMISSIAEKHRLDNEATVEYVDDEDDSVQAIELNAQNPLRELEQDNIEESNNIFAPYTEQCEQSAKQIVSVNQSIKVVKRPPNQPNSQNSSSKKVKVNEITTEKVTIQMNECLICPSILGDILELKDHIESHTNIKCKACNRQFARYSNLKRHFNNIHSKPKPFQCDLCGLGFNFSVNLQAHAALHYSGKIRND